MPADQYKMMVDSRVITGTPATLSPIAARYYPGIPFMELVRRKIAMRLLARALGSRRTRRTTRRRKSTRRSRRRSTRRARRSRR